MHDLAADLPINTETLLGAIHDGCQLYISRCGIYDGMPKTRGGQAGTRGQLPLLQQVGDPLPFLTEAERNDDESRRHGLQGAEDRPPVPWPPNVFKAGSFRICCNLDESSGARMTVAGQHHSASSKPMQRVLVAGFQHETNSFAPVATDYECFVRGGMFPAMHTGEAVHALSEVNVPLGGFLRAAIDRFEILPVIWAGATPAARVTSDAFERIAGDICSAAEAGCDAIYLDLHGAMMCEHLDDGEGELIRRLRAIVGENVPIVASLDLHANVTEAMLRNADGLVSYRTYPHEDMAATGSRAAGLLSYLIEHRVRLERHLRRLPFLIPINSMATALEPANSAYALLEQIERDGVKGLWLSFTPGFPAADFPECGGSVWAYGVDKAEVRRAVNLLADVIEQCEGDWATSFLTPQEAVRTADRIAKYATGPVIIADTQDNPGAGGTSNSTGMLRALLDEGVESAAIGLLVDPAAAALAHEQGVGSTISQL